MLKWNHTKLFKNEVASLLLKLDITKALLSILSIRSHYIGKTTTILASRRLVQLNSLVQINQECWTRI